MNNKETSTSIAPELFPRIPFCNGLGLLVEMLHKGCLLIGTLQSQHSSSASLPERKKLNIFIQMTINHLKITTSGLHD
jgi:hypothetical protein